MVADGAVLACKGSAMLGRMLLPPGGAVVGRILSVVSKRQGRFGAVSTVLVGTACAILWGCVGGVVVVV